MYDLQLIGHLTKDVIISGNKIHTTLGAMANLWEACENLNPSLNLNNLGSSNIYTNTFSVNNLKILDDNGNSRILNVDSTQLNITGGKVKIIGDLEVTGSGAGASTLQGLVNNLSWVGGNLSGSDWRSVTWSSKLGLFCAVASGQSGPDRIATSPDGLNWTSKLTLPSDRKSTRLNSSHVSESRMPSSA